MGNKTSLPGPDESIVLTPRIDYLETNRATLSGARVLVSTLLSNVQIDAANVTGAITSISARTPAVTTAISQNSSDINKLYTNSFNPLSLQYSKVYTTQTSTVQYAYQTDQRMIWLESILGGVNVSDLSNQTYNASLSVSGVGVAYSALSVFYNSVQAKWTPLDTLRSNVNASTNAVIALRDARLSDSIYQESAIVTVSGNTFSGKNDMLSYNSFMTSTLSYLSSAFLAAYNNRTTQTGSDLTSLQLMAKAVATRMSSLVYSVGLSVANEISGLGMFGNASNIIVLDSTTGPMQITTDLHNKVIFTNISYCLYFGLNLASGATYSDSSTTVAAAKNVDSGDWITIGSYTTASDIVKKYYPDGLTFTVVYTGTLAQPVVICTFRYLLRIMMLNAPDIYSTQSIDWFMNSNTSNVWDSSAPTGNWRGGYAVFTVGTLDGGGGARRCAVMNA